MLIASSTLAASDKSKLYGYWKSISGAPVKIHLMKDMNYVYQYKMLTFSGKWSVNRDNLTLNYKVLGSKRRKQAKYSLKRGFLTLHSDEYATTVLKKTR
ncbi:MAG: hypothetical protein CSB47_05710 [Proteobacteria bacterium]|nr:MAG: hypothetical protein CSB47_05710 [Pseudomonadota bacterium]